MPPKTATATRIIENVSSDDLTCLGPEATRGEWNAFCDDYDQNLDTLFEQHFKGGFSIEAKTMLQVAARRLVQGGEYLSLKQDIGLTFIWINTERVSQEEIACHIEATVKDFLRCYTVKVWHPWVHEAYAVRCCSRIQKNCVRVPSMEELAQSMATDVPPARFPNIDEADIFDDNESELENSHEHWP